MLYLFVMRKIFSLVLIVLFALSNSINAADYFTMGKTAFAQKNYRQANIYFVQALTQDPNNANCRYFYAQTLTYLKNYEQARKEYGYVIQLAPSSVAADYSQQAIMYLDQMYFSTKPKQNSSDSVASSDNYLKKALTSNGELVTWDLDKMPLKIYLDNSYRVQNFYIDAAKSALSSWQQASDGLISFAYTVDPNLADVKIVFKGVAQKTENQILGLTQHTSKNGYIDKVQVTLYTLGPNYKMLTAADVYNVALHEFGHMLGIWGHSDSKNDVMYSLYDVHGQSNRINLSNSDKNTIKALYEIDKNPYSTTSNSINKVLGNKVDRMSAKLQQNLDYVKSVPGNPIGYINVANTYKAMNKEYEAISYYKKALTIDRNNKDANLALATIYFNRNDLKNAEIYYKNLIKIEPKNPHSYCNLINLYIRNNKLSNANATLSSLLYRNPDAKNQDCIKSIMKTLGR